MPDSLTGQFLAGTRVIEIPQRRRKPSGYVTIEGAREHNLRDIDVKIPLGVLLLGDRRVGIRQVDARQRGALQGGRPTACTESRQRAGAHRRITGLEQLDKIISVDQSPIGRTPRSNPAHLHRAVRPDPRSVLQDPGGPRARLQAGPVLVQRQGRPLRGVPRRRPDQDRDALPARRVRALRAVPRQALQPGDARGAVQGQDDRRRARDADRGGARVLRPHPQDPPPGRGAERRRTGIHAARASPPRRCRAARHSGSSSPPSSRRSPPGRRFTSSTSPPPVCTSPTSSVCSRC